MIANRRIQYNYRSVQIGALWMVVSICILALVWGFNAYRANAKSQMEMLANKLTEINQPAQNEIAPQAQEIAAQPEVQPAQYSEVAPVLTWSVIADINGCTASASGGFDCPDGHILGINRRGEKIYSGE